jgi:hypothetical protein
LDGEKNKDNTKEKSTNMSEKDSNNKNWYFVFERLWSFVK